MKKIVFMLLAVLLTSNVLSQTLEEMKDSENRITKLEKLSKSNKNCGVPEIDELTNSVGDVAAESIEITPILQNMYYHSIGQTIDGINDVTVKKPTVEDLTELSIRIGKQAVKVKAVVDKIPNASEALEKIKKPTIIPKATKALKYCKDALEILGIESAFQVKAIAAMIETAKASNNL